MILATPSEYRSIAHLFGLGRSTASSIVHDTCRAIFSTLQTIYIRFPEGVHLETVVEKK